MDPGRIRDHEHDPEFVVGQEDGLEEGTDLHDPFPGEVHQTPVLPDIRERPMGVLLLDQDDPTLILGPVRLPGQVVGNDAGLHQALHDRIGGIIRGQLFQVIETFEVAHGFSP